MARVNQPRSSRCTESRLEWIVLGLGLLALFLLAISWRDLNRYQNLNEKDLDAAYTSNSILNKVRYSL